MEIFVPILGRPYAIPKGPLYPYSPAEQAKALPKLGGRSLFIEFQRDVDGPQTAARLVRETLGGFGVIWRDTISTAEAIIWIQAGSRPMRFACLVAHPAEAGRFVAAECGPRELTATIMTAVSEYFSSRSDAPSSGASSVIAEIKRLNRAITGASIAQDWAQARALMGQLALAVRQLGSLGGAQAAKSAVDALADSAAAYETARFPEAKAIREAAIAALTSIGTDSVPALKKGLSHSNAAVRKACQEALHACAGKPWWRFW